MTYMAGLYLNKQEEAELLVAFRAIDLNGDGVLTIDELIEGRLPSLR
jgi:Ca2+-binding EF-hand superfamily protein